MSRMWLDGGEMRSLITYLSAAPENKANKVLNEWLTLTEGGTTEPTELWKESGRSCPRDRVPLSKHYFAGTKIGLDSCYQCKGFWVDGPEVMALANEVEPNPELDEAWRAVVNDFGSFEKKLSDDMNKTQKVMLAGLISLKNPLYAVYLIAVIAVEAMLEDLLYLAEQEEQAS